jgi:hypothetical protein
MLLGWQAGQACRLVWRARQGKLRLLYYINTLKRDDFDDWLHLVLLLLFALDISGIQM